MATAPTYPAGAGGAPYPAGPSGSPYPAGASPYPTGAGGAPYPAGPSGSPYPTGPSGAPYPANPGGAPYPAGQGGSPYPTGPGAPPYPPGAMPPLERRATIIDSQATPEPPPAKTYPCGCGYPGDHKPDCMWSIWEQMQSNYVQTKNLMSKFMTNVNAIQGGGAAAGAGRAACECPPGCHGRDLGEAMGLQQMRGVTVPWQAMPLATPQPGTVAAPQTGYPVESEARRMMEEQRRIKNTWAQFMNLFDMALDLANDVSKDRWEAARRRRERARLERLERMEEQQRQRAERASTATSESKKDEKEEKKREEKEEEEEKEVKSTSKESSPPEKTSTDDVEEVETRKEDETPEDTGAQEQDAAQEPVAAGDETAPADQTPDPENPTE